MYNTVETLLCIVQFNNMDFVEIMNLIKQKMGMTCVSAQAPTSHQFFLLAFVIFFQILQFSFSLVPEMKLL